MVINSLGVDTHTRTYARTHAHTHTRTHTHTHTNTDFVDENNFKKLGVRRPSAPGLTIQWYLAETESNDKSDTIKIGIMERKRTRHWCGLNIIKYYVLPVRSHGYYNLHVENGCGD